MRTVRYYLKYCYENGFSDQELFSKIPNIYYNRQSRLPSSYSSDEVDTLLKSIDVGNPCGKRDYAIILLISRLGLRSSDVADLRFSKRNGYKPQPLRRVFIKKANGKLRPLGIPTMKDTAMSHYFMSWKFPEMGIRGRYKRVFRPYQPRTAAESYPYGY